MCLHKKIIILYDELSGNRIQGSQSSYRFTFPCPESVICNILYLLRRIKNDTPYRFCLWLLLNDTLLACGFPATHPEILLIESLPYILPYLRCYKNVTPSFIAVPIVILKIKVQINTGVQSGFAVVQPRPYLSSLTKLFSFRFASQSLSI